MSKKSIYQQIKSAFEQAPERPLEEDMWADMQSRLEEDKEQRSLPIWLVLGFLFLVSASIFILIFTEKSTSNTNDNLVLELENEEKSVPTISINNHQEEQANLKGKDKLVTENNSKKTNTKTPKPSSSLKLKGLGTSKSENSQIADIEIVESRKVDFEDTKEQILKKKTNTGLDLYKLSEKEAIPLLSRSLKTLRQETGIEGKMPDICLIPFSSSKSEKHKIQIGIFTGKTFSYLNLSTLSLIPEESKSSKLHFGFNTLLKLNESFKLGFNLHYKEANYSRFNNWDNIPMTSTHFVSKTDSAPNLLGIGLNFSYYPLKNKAVSPYLGVGIQQDLKLQETRIYYFSPGIYSTDLSEYTETKNLKGEVLRNRTSLIKLGTEVRLSSRIQVFAESLRHLPLGNEIDVYNYKWSWRAGVLFNLKQ